MARKNVSNTAQTLPLITADIHSIKCSVKLAQKVSLEAVIRRCDTVINKEGVPAVVRWKRYPNFIVLSSAAAATHMDSSKTTKSAKTKTTTRPQQVKYTLFKYSDTMAKDTPHQAKAMMTSDSPAADATAATAAAGYYYRQHCNVCGLKAFSDIVPALDRLAQWLALPVDDLFLQVDNLIATAPLPSAVDKLVFVKANPHVKAHFQLERFPSIILKPDIRPRPPNGMLANLVQAATSAFKHPKGPQTFKRQRRKRKSAGIAILLYASGSTVISGAKTVAELTDCCQFLGRCFAAYQTYQQRHKAQSLNSSVAQMMNMSLSTTKKRC